VRTGLWAVAVAVVLASGLSAAAQAAHDLARAEEIVQGRCFVCHGAEGESSSPLFPRLAGQNAAYLARQLADYQSGRRQNSTMRPMVEGLSPSDFQALGAWFASRPTRGHVVADAELARAGRVVYARGNASAGVSACASCHGDGAHGTATLPRLAGQHAQYIENQLRQFNTRQRNNDQGVMHAVASRLSEHELKAVAAYLSGLE